MLPESKHGLLNATLCWATVLGESVTDLAWSNDNRLLYAASVDGQLIACQDDGDWLFRSQLHQDAITGIAVQPNGELLASAGEDGAVQLCNAGTGELQQTLLVDAQWSDFLDWSPDGYLLASAAGKRLCVNDIQSGEQNCVEHPGSVGALAWAPSGKRLASGANKGVYLWNVGVWEPVRVLDFPGAAISLAWNQDGKALAAGTQDGFMHVRLQGNHGKARQLSMSGYPGKVACLAWRPGKLSRQLCIASCGGNDVVLWYLHPVSGERKALPLRQHDRPVTQLAWSYDGSLLASGDRGGRVCFWSGSGEFLFDMELGSEVTALQWHAKDRLLAVGNIDGSLRLFSLAHANTAPPAH
ncbi:MAG: hypothetical protein PVG66_04170 [Chromatiales bacterium]